MGSNVIVCIIVVVSIIGQLVIVTKAAHPSELPERGKPVVHPVFFDHRFALLSQVAENERYCNPLNDIDTNECVEHESVH